MDNFNIFTWLKELLTEIVNQQYALKKEIIDSIAIEVPKDPSHGDLSTNAAMILASHLKANPRQIAATLSEKFAEVLGIAEVSVAGPGFINFTFNKNIWHKVLSGILVVKENYGKSEIGQRRKVNIEYVSANPTGPMHIGHARGAVYGDALARVMDYCGFEVVKEYYINDAGNQVNVLAETAYLRYKQAVTDKEIIIPEGYYPGEYLIPVGQKLADIYGDSLLTKNKEEYLPLVKKVTLEMMLEQIKADLAKLNIFHDVFFSENSLHTENMVKPALEKLKSAGLIYEGKMPAPKGIKDDEWQERDQLLFKSTDFGDDLDRPLQKSDGTWTYFASDIAYAASKIARGFLQNIVVLGADHGGYVKRLQAVYESLSEGKASVEVKLCQLVNFIENGQPVKMSKRAGSFTTVRDVIDEVGNDILRFVMLTRKNDMILDFDLDLVKEQSKDNPVFYVQYGQVRANSVLNNCLEHFPEAFEIFKDKKYDINLLSTNIELNLIKQLALWPKLLEGVAQTGEVHRIPYYLQSIASYFHSFWNQGKEQEDLRFVVYGNKELTAARMALVEATKDVIRCGLKLIGVSPVEKM